MNHPKIDHLQRIADERMAAAREAGRAVQAASARIRETRGDAEMARREARGYESPEAERIEAGLPALIAERDRLQASYAEAGARADAAGQLLNRCIAYNRQHPPVHRGGQSARRSR